MKKTKIICTIGPASQSRETLSQLVKEGMNIARFNFSHGDHTEQLNKISLMREVNTQLSTNVALLLDTRGPEIRTHEMENNLVVLKKDDILKISMTEVLGTKEMISVTYSGLINDVNAGSTILVDDGLVELTVISKEGNIITTKVENDGSFKSRRGINVPNVKLNFDFISQKDKADIEFACDNDLDFIAASFVRRRDDVLAIREILKSKNNDHIKIIAKIENEEGVSNLEEIIEAADGIMVARGDLGVEVPLEEVPVIQKKIVKLCNQNHKPVIVATQMLDSMQKNPRPTRAEVSDVTNAIIDGADAIMLSGETANGDYPVKSVQTMSKIAEYAEKHLNYSYYTKRAYKDAVKSYRNVIATSAVYASKDMDAKAIIASTGSGKSADLISNFRPKCQIIAATPSSKVARSLAINFGVCPLVVPHISNADEFTKFIMPVVKEKLSLTEGDDIVITGGFETYGTSHTNLMRFEKIK